MNKFGVLGGLAFVGAAIAGGYILIQEGERVQQSGATEVTTLASDLSRVADGEIQFCLTWLEEGDQCVTRGELRAMADRPLMKKAPPVKTRLRRPEPKAMTATLAHPTDMSVAERTVTNCTDFNTLKGEGWGGLTSADMADERWFLARCGLFILAERATVPTYSAFADGRLSEGTIYAIPAKDWPQIGEPVGDIDLTLTKPTNPKTKRAAERFWTVEYGNMRMLVSEVAHADFNGDGYGDILVLMNGAPRDRGTLRVTRYGLVEKSGTGQVTLREVEIY